MNKTDQAQQLLNNVFYFMIIGIFLILKYLHKIAETKDLKFLLEPIDKIISLFTGLQSIETAEGAFSIVELNILIDKSCSGFNFLILCFMMLACLCVKYFDRVIHKLGMVIFTLALSYLITIIVNSSRIVTSLLFEHQIHQAFNLDSNIMHLAIGVTTNISFLILTYLFVEQTLKRIKTLQYKQNFNERLT